METYFSLDQERNEVVAKRVFKTSREKLWQAYTSPGMIERWWGPDGISVSVAAQDFQPNGAWHFVQTTPEGEQFSFHGIYKSIEPEEELISTIGAGASGEANRLETAIFKDWPNHRVRLTLITRYETKEALNIAIATQVEQGTKQAMDRLERVIKEAYA